MGGLLRLIILGAIVWFIYNALQRATGNNSNARRQAQDGYSPPPGGNVTTMRKCSYCGVHIPEGESTQSRGHYFCNEAHRDSFFRQQG